MYEEHWYAFVPDQEHKKNPSQSPGHRRKESLLQQSGISDAVDPGDALPDLVEEPVGQFSLPEATLSRRAKSYSNFQDMKRLQPRPRKGLPDRGESKRRERRSVLDAVLSTDYPSELLDGVPLISNLFQDELLEASQQEFLIYHDQLSMTERHLDSLIQETNTALDLLASLSKSFHSVEEQTTSFKSQCDSLLVEKERLQTLADEIGMPLHYYGYLDNVTRRLNAPGASRLVDDDAFGEILHNLDSCIAFMASHPTYCDAETYLARYRALLAKALHLLEVGFTSRLETVSSETGRQLAVTQSESARHALAYGRFQEMLLDSYSLIPNIQKVVQKAYDRSGNPREDLGFISYASTANNLFQEYFSGRDRHLKPISQSDVDVLKNDGKDVLLETAARTFIKQCFERSFSEAILFSDIFSIELHYSTLPNSAFVALKYPQRSLVTGINICPISSNLQATLQQADLKTICGIVGWILNEYLLPDFDEEERPLTTHCREVAARLLAEHLWSFVDSAFEAEIVTSISKAPLLPEHLKMGSLVEGDAASNAFPPIKRALELLVMFDQCMPKERCQRDSTVVYKLIQASISALRRAESRLNTAQTMDPDLFMIKNLLLLKNELVVLEIGDVRIGTHTAAASGSMQHFSQIWDTALSSGPQAIMGLLSSIGSYLPLPRMPSASSLWAGVSLSRGATPSPSPAPSIREQTSTINSSLPAPTSDGPDASEQLDHLLRTSIYAFTQRWATALVTESRRGGNQGNPHLGGTRNNTGNMEKQLDEMLVRAFSNQPEVVARLKEAIEMNVEAQMRGSGDKGGVR